MNTPYRVQTLPNMLALDLSGGVAELALQTEQASFHEQGMPGRTHSTDLLPMLEQLLQRGSMEWDKLEMFALVTGPGSFTGLRIAAATLAGLNSRLQLPVLPLSALAVTAMQSGSTRPVYVCEDARAGDCYVGHYHHGKPLAEDRCMSWQALAEYLPPDASFVSRQPPSPLLQAYTRLVPDLPRGVAMLQQAAVELAAMDHPEALPRYPLPAYLQASQAERHAGGY